VNRIAVLLVALKQVNRIAVLATDTLLLPFYVSLAASGANIIIIIKCSFSY
jgi:hypothetical protein